MNCKNCVNQEVDKKLTEEYRKLGVIATIFKCKLNNPEYYDNRVCPDYETISSN